MSAAIRNLGVAKRFQKQGPSIWVEINRIVAQEKPLNLGQGFPDFLPKQHVLDSLASVATASCDPLLHQYTRAFGHMRLVQALGKLYSPMMGLTRDLDPLEEILISVGGYGSLFTAINALIDPGDEVVIIEPFFDCYSPMVEAVQGVPVFVPLRPTKAPGCRSDIMSSGDWKLDLDELTSKINGRTKMIMVNTPNNPCGKVFNGEELEAIAALCIRHNLICISDEVYEWLVYPPDKHIKIASLPGMWERTLTIGSAGKTFSVTGWKLGWTVGPSNLIAAMQTAHQNCVYTCATPLQEAVAQALETEIALLGTPQSYFTQLTDQLIRNRDAISAELTAAGMPAIVPQGGYFVLADISKLDFPEAKSGNPGEAFDVRFNKWMIRNKKLSAIPPSVFYSEEHRHLGERYLRFCFIKKEETLQKAYAILRQWRSSDSGDSTK